MYEVKLYDGGGHPLIKAWCTTEEAAISLAKFLVEGEEPTWRAEVWNAENRLVYPVKPNPQ